MNITLQNKVIPTKLTEEQFIEFFWEPSFLSNKFEFRNRNKSVYESIELSLEANTNSLNYLKKEFDYRACNSTNPIASTQSVYVKH